MIRNTVNPYDPRILARCAGMVALAVACFWLALTVPVVRTWEDDDAR
jgi:hypothetical protein